MEELLKFVVTNLVDNAADVTVDQVPESDKVVILNITVNPADMGKVIGKGGKVAGAIRTIVKSASGKSGKRFIVKILEKK